MRLHSSHFMQYSSLQLFLLITIFMLSTRESFSCTNFMVGSKASVDGSVMCTYNADDYGMFIGLCHYPAAKHAKGDMRQIIDWDTHEYRGKIPEAVETYNVIGNINEYQVTIGETTYGGREEMVSPNGLLDYGSLIYLALQRSKSAREAIGVMTSLADIYGYGSEGESFSVCDSHEAWLLEMMGKGKDSKGAVWVAMRVPDNAICGHANQSRIGCFLNKSYLHEVYGSSCTAKQIKQWVLYSPDVVTFARSKGWFTGNDADFSWKMVYDKPDFGGRRFCDARVWAFFNHYSSDFGRYLPWALGKDSNAEDMPLWIVPNHKLSVQDLQASMRDHYEGTPLEIDSTDIGGGIWQMPYRPTPLSFTCDGKECFNERPTSTQQTGFTYVSQMRSWLPREIGGILWFGNDDSNMVAYTPIYCSSTVQPECYNTPGADALTFSDHNAYWVCNWVSNMVYPRYNMMFSSLKNVRDSLENSYFSLQPALEKKAIQLYSTDKTSAIALLNKWSCDKAQQMLARWKQLAVYLIVKYNDMTVRRETNGHFLRTNGGIAVPVERVGFPQSYRKELIKQSGDRYVKSPKK